MNTTQKQKEDLINATKINLGHKDEQLYDFEGEKLRLYQVQDILFHRKIQEAKIKNPKLTTAQASENILKQYGWKIENLITTVKPQNGKPRILVINY